VSRFEANSDRENQSRYGKKYSGKRRKPVAANSISPINRNRSSESSRTRARVSPKYTPTTQKPPENIFNTLFNYIFRVAIVGVGMGTIFGSVLANVDLTQPLFPEIDLPFLSDTDTENDGGDANALSAMENQPTQNLDQTQTSFAKAFRFSSELIPLREKFTKVFEKYPNLEPSAFFVDLDNGAFVNYNGITPFPAASTIKTPILIAFFQDVDAGKVLLDEKLTMTEKTRASEAGTMQYQPLGTEYTALKVAEEMIIRSDNTATNMIIERLGRAESLNKRFQEWGLESTVINNYLPDLEGTNTISARDLAIVLMKVDQGDLISLRSRDRALNIMEQTITKTLLPQGIEPNANIYHKTGDIGKVLGDGGIIDIPTGKRYIGAILVKRPYNDPNGRTMIQETSREAYQHFKWYQPRP